jgi:antitoxin ParD1/3/4
MPSRDVRDGSELVIRDVLQHRKERRAHQDMDVEELRRLWQAGIESGPGRFRSIDAIKKEARRQVAKVEP